MIYPVHDSHGKRIGTVMTEKDSAQNERWIAYGTDGQREVLPSWEDALKWVEQSATKSHSSAK